MFLGDINLDGMFRIDFGKVELSDMSHSIMSHLMIHVTVPRLRLLNKSFQDFIDI